MVFNIFLFNVSKWSAAYGYLIEKKAPRVMISFSPFTNSTRYIATFFPWLRCRKETTTIIFRSSIVKGLLLVLMAKAVSFFPLNTLIEARNRFFIENHAFSNLTSRFFLQQNWMKFPNCRKFLSLHNLEQSCAWGRNCIFSTCPRYLMMIKTTYCVCSCRCECDTTHTFLCCKTPGI